MVERGVFLDERFCLLVGDGFKGFVPKCALDVAFVKVPVKS